MTNDRRDGLLYLLLAAGGFAFMPTLAKTIYAYSTFEPIDLSLWRFIFAVPMIWALVWMRRRGKVKQAEPALPIRNIMLVGVVFSLASLTAFWGLERLPASTYIVLFYTYPAIVVIFSGFLGEPIKRMAWIALGMALFGVVLTVPDFMTVGALDMVGVAFAFANAIVAAIYYLMSKRILAGVKSVFSASAYMMLGTLCVLLLLIPIRGIQFPSNIETLLCLLTIAVVCTVMPIFATNQGIQKVGASQASLISTAEPVMSMVVAMVLLGEIILPIQWLGAAFIVGSVILLQIRPARKLHVVSEPS